MYGQGQDARRLNREGYKMGPLSREAKKGRMRETRWLIDMGTQTDLTNLGKTGERLAEKGEIVRVGKWHPGRKTVIIFGGAR